MRHSAARLKNRVNLLLIVATLGLPRPLLANLNPEGSPAPGVREFKSLIEELNTTRFGPAYLEFFRELAADRESGEVFMKAGLRRKFSRDDSSGGTYIRMGTGEVLSSEQVERAVDTYEGQQFLRLFRQNEAVYIEEYKRLRRISGDLMRLGNPGLLLPRLFHGRVDLADVQELFDTRVRSRRGGTLER